MSLYTKICESCTNTFETDDIDQKFCEECERDIYKEDENIDWEDNDWEDNSENEN